MFTTLSTKVSRLEIPGRRVVITDSVGFISDLPTSLLQAFNTTLMETGAADLILLVVDGSDPVDEMKRKVRACFETFERIGVQNPNTAVVLNKIDLIGKDAISNRIACLKQFSGKVIPISAKTGANMDQLLEEVMRLLPIWHKYSVTIPYRSDSMSLLSWIHEVTRVESEVFGENAIAIEALLSPSVAQKLLKTLPDGSVKCAE
jgi:GTP-binding protein HflX